MKTRRKKGNPAFHVVQRPQTPEPDHPRWPEYLRTFHLTGYKSHCNCHACDSNRAYFSHWLSNREKEEEDTRREKGVTPGAE